ncbi:MULTISPECIES: restriction endonuclease subunit S [Thiorhodovibrio]|uniref:restriction endonuclease subunit S n=1 Tax=Thiorhodovibrio TaxID=61593 RepID=UPI001912768E|nr:MULTISPECIES: restriction endonuclease subunit S [Thiorhodovibrio]MBK5968482.1 hypothetical protein [Thiorhodovibrio winogradskyi]WPL11127.1 Type I restriction enzyme EcoKI specificity protein [Thiorhodovibrio litoralis]
MNPQRLLQHFDRIAEAPDAVARLRRFVLDLAVRGKLVEQDPNDESVSKTLRSIKVRGFSEGAFPVPTVWAWIDVGSVAEARLGKMLDKGKNKGNPRPYLRNVNVRWFNFDLADLLEMRFKDSELAEFELRSGDVLICEGGEPGRAAVWDQRARGIYFQKAIHRVRFSPVVDPHFFAKALKASSEDGRLQQSFTGTGIKHFTGRSLAAYRFPLPPLPEQHRIVAKVDELMVLCDRLEAAQAKREQRRDLLVAASLRQLQDEESLTQKREGAKKEKEASRKKLCAFAPSREPIFLRDIPRLTTRPEHIKYLRQTILGLAVSGELVPQDQQEEPASSLLKQIANEIAAYATANGIVPTRPDHIAPVDMPFAAPLGWQWTRLCALFNVITDGDHQPPPRAESGIAFLTIGNVTTGRLDFAGCRFVPENYFRSLPMHRTPCKGDILYTVVGATFGRPAVVDTDRKFCVQRHIAILKPTASASLHFMAYLMASPLVYSQASNKTTGTAQPTIGLRPLRNFVVPLPPLAEQHRIVAKVDELMAICDQLEAQLDTTQTDSRRLLEAVLHEALASATAAELAA